MPFPNEHACMIDSSLKTVGTQTRDHNGKRYLVHIGKKKGGGSGERSYLYPRDKWTKSEAAAHCKSHGGTFEAATETGKVRETELPAHLDPKKNPMIKLGEE
jgi:hypothetical protein